MKSEFNTLWQKYGTFGILIIVMVVFGIGQPALFFSFDNITQIILQSSMLPQWLRQSERRAK